MKARGLTLIEIMVALLVVAGLFALVIPAVQGATGVRVKEEAGKMIGAIHLLYSEAAMRGEVCRLMFQLSDGTQNGGYRAECTEQNAQLEVEAQDVDDGEAVIDEDPFADDSQIRDDERLEATVKARAAYSAFEGRSFKAHSLPTGVRLTGFWTPLLRDVVTKGEVGLYFLPLGETQRAYLWLQDDSDNFFTLKVSPLTGSVKVFAENLEVPSE